MSLRARPHFSITSVLMGLSLATGCGGENTYFRSMDDVGGPATEGTADAAPSYLKTFDAGNLQTANLSIDSGFNLIQQDFLLVQAPKSAELSQQIDRAIYEDNYTQGHSGISSSQNFAISEAGIFDLLVVMDNSSSMGPYQNRISRNLPSILKYISNTNWRIAVVTTTNACLNKTTDGRKYITRADYDADPVKTTSDFQKLIKIGEGGDPVEKGIKVAADAMIGQGCPNATNEWLRPDSQRSILLITDEKNCGSGSNEGCPGTPYETAQYFYDRVGYNVPVNAFLLLQEPPTPTADPNDPNHDCENSGGYMDPPNPIEYTNMVAATGGISTDICRSNYSSVLEQISLNVRKKVNIQFELGYPAVASSLEIKLDGKKVNSFTVSGKTLTILETVAPSSQSLAVNYKHDPVAMVKAFTPTHAADTTSFDVTINGDMLSRDLFHFDTTTGKLELNNIPPEHAAIKLKYRDSTALRKVFTYAGNFVPGSLEVWVNDKKVTSGYVHDENLKKVTFTTAPVDASQVSLRYELPGDKKLKYPILGADAARIENFRLTDRDSNEELSAQVDNGNLVIDGGSVSNGRKVRAIYNMNYDFKDKVYSIKIAGQPFPDTLKISAAGDEQICNRNVEVHADTLGFSCSDEDFEKLDISYKYADDYHNTFDIAVDYSGPKTYKVYINGTETTLYHIMEDKLVILKKDLPAGSTVKVLIQPR